MSFLLVAVAGALAIGAFPDLGWWPLIFVAFAPLMIVLEGASPKRRLALGWLFGTIFMAGKQHWVATTLVNLSGFSWALAIPCLILYAAWHGLQWGLFALGYGVLRRWAGRGTWVVVVALWYVALESVWPQMFPLRASYALWEQPVLLQIAEWVGTAGVSWLVLLVSCALVHVVEEVSRGRTSDQLIPTAVAALWLLSSVWGVVRMQQVWDAPVQGQPTVVLIQPNVTVAEKRSEDPAARQGVYERTEKATREAMKLRPDMVVWPEGGFPWIYQPEGAEGADDGMVYYSRRLRRLALELGVPLVAGSLRAEGERVANSALYFAPGGGEALAYDKQRLVPFGERVPFADTFPALEDVVPGMSHHRGGTRDVTILAAGFRWALSICYEAIQPGATRRSVNTAHADVMLNLTNDVWFGPHFEPRQHLMAQVPRAIENRMWLVRSTNSGISAFVDPTGSIRGLTPQGAESVLALEMSIPALKRSVYRRHGDLIFWLACGLAALWLLWVRQDQLRNFRRRRGVTPSSPANAERES
jgi:apolipoprotein N-acyltransferase